ncbi:MAG: glycosyl hydrolase family 17 [Bacteroidota bacterium]|nr:glycosyl hydrolase family 17 [Bacteroidota bacterium]MDX5430279.1 glycosyl hydrolase family 17 [Bacteroidota bacterium]MDX5469040.1 glycosyl hydrolase family 17 [Bacteroidota bacterium]
MKESVNASYILGNPDFPAICYGGYRETSREMEPSITQLKEDMKLLSALGIKLLRTYNTHFKEARNLLQAIRELKEENAQFEMYVMLGAWIDCENAWTEFPPNHEAENEKANSAEIQRAVELANAFPETVKIIAVGNESMVRWAESYYVQPKVILRWVKHLQDLKRSGKLDQNLWITSSDNFASWGGDSSYHCADLEELIRAVDYVSLHTYPMHDTHYNPNFWGVLEPEMHLPKTHMIRRVMKRALVYAQGQYYRTSKYIHSIDSTKPVHIGETGWASESTGHYGLDGSMACDEYKQGLYYHLIRNWTNKEGISCFFFEAFNEQWKDAQDPKGSENHFGLFTLTGEAKYALWDLVDQKQFEGLYRDGHPVRKTYAGNLDSLLKEVAFPPVKQLR